VSYDEAQDFATKHKLHFFEVSAILNKNIEEAMNVMAREIIEVQEKNCATY
jgi:hypothetical protein